MTEENKCESIPHEVLDKIDKDGWTKLVDAVAFVIKWGGMALVLIAGAAEFAVVFLYSWQWLTNRFPL